MIDRQQARVDLGRVSETALWTLYQRATEARRPDTVLHGPTAVALVDVIDYPFRARWRPRSTGHEACW